MRRVYAVVLIVILTFPPDSAFTQSQHAPPKKVMTAVRVNPSPPRIDGVLDDEAWRHASAFSGFTQQQPNEGAAPTESTTVQILYDDEALYVGIMAYDREPDKIIARLTRRDEWTKSDRVSVDMDPYHDHQTGVWFGINAAGTLDDGVMFNDTDFDQTWDGVWIARSAINDRGWSAEYKIPYHVLRFSPKEEYVWGINIIRDIGRRNEKQHWVLVPRNVTSWISQMGHLEGIKGIDPPTALEIVPYTTTRSTFEPKSPTSPNGRDFFINGGGDLRYGLTSTLSLKVTANPDFGQVEADPAVLNLSTFETFFEERRPFFVEGANTFQTPIQLFYSRRVGRQPGYFRLPAGAALIHRPDFTTIAGAAKLTGKTKNRTTFGLLEAVTTPENAVIDRLTTDPVTAQQQPIREKYRVEPLTNFTVGRIQQDFGSNSNVGLLATALNRADGAGFAYSGGMDWNLRWHRNTYEFSGQVAGTQVDRPGIRQRGYASRVKWAKISGWLVGRAEFQAYSPGFNPNDLGFQERSNLINPWARVGVQKTRPWGPFRQIKTEVTGFGAWNYNYEWAGNRYDRVTLEKGFEVEGEVEWRNFWRTGGNVFRQFESLSDLESRGGPLLLNPTLTGYGVSIESDNRHAVNGEVEVEWGSHRGGSAWRWISGRLTFRPVPNIELSFNPEYQRNRFNAQWIDNVDDNQDGIADHFVFGRLRGHVLDMTTRANITFTRNLSMQFYLQPFVAVGRYIAINELARPSSYDFTPYTGVIPNPDFNSRSLRSNLVVRWEYRPGSTLFLVWAQSRSHFSNDPTFRPLRNLSDAFSDNGPNVFAIKLSYWLNM